MCTRSYILNRGWIDKSARRLPTYKEITGKGKREAESDSEADASGSEAGPKGEVDGLPNEDEDEFDDIADAFESSYNFRFEEPYVPYFFPHSICLLMSWQRRGGDRTSPT